MTIDIATPLLGGLSPQTFMRRHWQKKPLLIRQALPGAEPTLDRAAMFALVATEGVESRLIERRAGRWSLRHGPFTRRQLPPLARPDWTLLVQGVDLHLPAAHRLLSRFRFASDARLDDLMISYATDGGGVGPHIDSYDVFLLQLAGRRRWRVSRVTRPELVPDMPLKLLANFEPEMEWVLDAGDMLYLPPGWAHEGMADGECLTASIGFRAPTRDEVGRQVLQRMLDGADDDEGQGARYRDVAQAATDQPARIPVRLAEFAAEAVRRVADDPSSLDCALGEWLSEPKPQTWFEPAQALSGGCAVALDRRSRMLYDDRHVFINGESFVASGRDARLMRRLADGRTLDENDVAALSPQAQELLQSWVFQGWLRAADGSARN
ncbi:MAG: cupin [Burkholderiales bacterium PBB1]|nr:MAG: cupin [Burkholderiales bacterium PBB1]